MAQNYSSQNYSQPQQMQPVQQPAHLDAAQLEKLLMATDEALQRALSKCDDDSVRVGRACGSIFWRLMMAQNECVLNVISFILFEHSCYLLSYFTCFDHADGDAVPRAHGTGGFGSGFCCCRGSGYDNHDENHNNGDDDGDCYELNDGVESDFNSDHLH